MLRKLRNLFGGKDDKDEKGSTVVINNDKQSQTTDKEKLDDAENIDDNNRETDDVEEEKKLAPTITYIGEPIIVEGYTMHNENDPLLKPIHGIGLEDYAAILFLQASEWELDDAISLFEIDKTRWLEINSTWENRMNEDSTFTISTLFSQYYNLAEKHPKLR